MEYFEVARLLFFASMAIGILIISIQLGRLLEQLTGTVRDTRKTIDKVDKLVGSVEEDYSEIRKRVFSILDFAEQISTALTSLTGLAKIFEMVQNLFGSSKNPSPDEDDKESDEK